MHPDDELDVRVIRTMAGHCEICHRDFSMWEMGSFLDDDDDDSGPISTWYECSHCGYREDG